MLRNILSLNLSPQFKLIALTAMVLAAIIAIVMHEIAHGYIAMTQGDYTAKMSGRLTLNPLAHFDLFGFLIMLTVGIGWAKPVPINPNNFRNTRKGIFLVSIAGVVTNLIIAIISLILYLTFYTTIQNGLIIGSAVAFFFACFLEYLIVLNIGLFAFNLIPIFPLDGFRIIESCTRYGNKFCVFMRRYGMQIFLGLFLLGFVADFLGIWWLDILNVFVTLIKNSVFKFISWLLGLIGIL